MSDADLNSTVSLLNDKIDRLRARVAELEVWREAALQAAHDLHEIEDAFALGEPPIGPGQRFAEWTCPANTMRWIARLTSEGLARSRAEEEK